MADLLIVEEQQELSEKKFYDVDFAPKLRTGASISGTPTVTHKNPDGTAGSAAVVGVVNGAIIPVKVGPLTQAGVNLVFLTVNTSDVEILQAQLVIRAVDW